MTLTNKFNLELGHDIEDNREQSARYEVLVAVLIRGHVSWDVMLNCWPNGSQRFDGP